ncbi:hypothetical protein DCAR_0730338 [Daucus carota subsp. sativus]|uniref:Helitron helicase-like domain-containing protein n=1 Tax=Daucus carota subsp. sativus TaxID=79200 RepID=A0AAF0XMK5_DAUCS|nr:PREDICTED: uncharacterized protein LOC108195097 [Daucus carota subsp. sativus]WOH10863.1 hypothetical protein DCAR_0730338 [Daucus carota subsp. sativus]
MRWVNVKDQDKVDVQVVQGLINMLDDTNELVREFRTRRDRFENNDIIDLKITLKVCRAQSGRENHIAPSDEVAGIMVGESNTTCGDRDIIIDSYKDGLERISFIHPKLMALQYPILFPNGEDGYHDQIPFEKNGNNSNNSHEYISMKDYYYKFQVRESEGMTARLGGRLFQQYMVDAFSSIEQTRLWWFRINQTTLRNELYTHICDSLRKGNSDSSKVGKVMYVVEFQKRGLPHVHMLIWLDSPSKMYLKQNVDKFVSAEIPDPLKDPVGYAAVKQFMMHGPCGLQNPKSQCMKKFRCIRHFPKAYSSRTVFDESGFPLYMRRKQDITVRVRKTDLDNQWVVPYNRDLLVTNNKVFHKSNLPQTRFFINPNHGAVEDLRDALRLAAWHNN